MKFVLLIYRTAPPEIDLPAEADRAALARHQKLQRRMKGDLLAVARLDDARHARTVRKQASAHAATDGPFPETKEWLVGFYLVDCADLAEAEARAAALADEHHAVEVRAATWTSAR